jgi:hypothetical protein
MSFKFKTIAISVIALSAVGGGIYAASSDTQNSTPQSTETADAGNGDAKTAAPGSQDTPAAQNVQKTGAQSPAAAVTPQPGKADQPASPTPVKLTQKQLTPPAATEAEKLQKAAEQESNF